MSRLIIVSNRVSYPTKRQNSSAGGLAITLQMALQKRGGFWFGWSGSTYEDFSPDTDQITNNNIDYVLLHLSSKQIKNYYYGFSNSVLWPLCHYRQDLIKYSHKDYNTYIEVNKLFATNLVPYLKKNDVIWVHDYHLIPLASELRKLGVQNPIGFFLHVPFPCYDIFCAAPPYKELLSSLCEYNLLGFQTKNDENNFLSCVNNTKIKTGVFPATVDSKVFEKFSQMKLPKETWQHLAAQLKQHILTIGVDRLDYSKGIIHRLQIYEQFLAKHKNYAEKIKFLQITPKSRSDIDDYQKIQQEIAEQTGKINGRFSTLNWAPITYINKNIEQSTLSLLYRHAKIAMVTPMRDGMNLVAKEYIASQDPTDPGVLILSHFAGAAKHLDSALLINPLDTQDCVKALETAISMPLCERIERWQPMKKYIDEHNTEQWCNSFLNTLQHTQ